MNAPSGEGSPKPPRARREHDAPRDNASVPRAPRDNSGASRSPRGETNSSKPARAPHVGAHVPQDDDPDERRPDWEEREARSSTRASTEANAPRIESEVLTSKGAPTIWKGKTLNAFQVEAVEAIQAGHDVLVSAPTGAGKTLVAEYAIEDAVKRGRRCIYTAPIKALSNQKYRDFRDDPAIDVGLMTGDVTIHPTAQVLIMTTEILRNAIFDDPQYLADVEYVVFDEVHYMDDFERGSVWEESLIFAPATIRFICLSATVSNVTELGAWLSEIRGRETVVIQSDKRPVPLTHLLVTQRSGVVDPKELEHVRKREGDTRAKFGKSAQKRSRHEAARGQGRALTEVPDPAPLFDELQRRKLLPALVFAFSRKDCERIAWNNQRRELLDVLEEERMKSLQEELVRLFQLDREILDGDLFAMARRGIAYHHAGMLPIHKELVERMFTSGLLKLLFTTETFALGINMPARCVVFYSLRKFDGVTFDYMQTRDYMQMAGRAGRQGIDREGLVFSLLSPKDLAEAPIKRLLAGRPEPVESRFRLSFSSILHVVERLGRARVFEAWEKSFNQFQHRGSTKKQQEQNRHRQRLVIDAHLAFLDELGYLKGDELTPRGNVAKLINGYELQITELLFGGTLENLPADALAVVFVGLVYEERRRGETTWVPAKLYGNVRTSVQREVHSLVVRAADHELADTIKMPDWGLTATTRAWIDGATFEEIDEHSDATPGDIVRNFRMAVQLMRQVRRAIDPKWDLFERLGEAMDSINRDVVDARRQLELG